MEVTDYTAIIYYEARTKERKHKDSSLRIVWVREDDARTCATRRILQNQ